MGSIEDLFRVMSHSSVGLSIVAWTGKDKKGNRDRSTKYQVFPDPLWSCCWDVRRCGWVNSSYGLGSRAHSNEQQQHKNKTSWGKCYWSVLQKKDDQNLRGSVVCHLPGPPPMLHHPYWSLKKPFSVDSSQCTLRRLWQYNGSLARLHAAMRWCDRSQKL